MTTDTTENGTLEAALQTLLLQTFADGEAVEGTWTVESVPEEIPDWSVSITRTDDRER